MSHGNTEQMKEYIQGYKNKLLTWSDLRYIKKSNEIPALNPIGDMSAIFVQTTYIHAWMDP
jgi:hypothetical protein